MDVRDFPGIYVPGYGFKEGYENGVLTNAYLEINEKQLNLSLFRQFLKHSQEIFTALGIKDNWIDTWHRNPDIHVVEYFESLNVFLEYIKTESANGPLDDDIVYRSAHKAIMETLVNHGHL